MIFFNWFGALWALIGFGAAVGLQEIKLLPYGDNRFYMVAAVIIFMLDVLYRLFVTKRKGDERNNSSADVLSHWLLGPRMGGSLMFLPAWVCSILVPVWYVYVVSI